MSFVRYNHIHFTTLSKKIGNIALIQYSKYFKNMFFNYNSLLDVSYLKKKEDIFAERRVSFYVEKS